MSIIHRAFCLIFSILKFDANTKPVCVCVQLTMQSQKPMSENLLHFNKLTNTHRTALQHTYI